MGIVLPALSVGALRQRDALRVIGKEALSGLTVGLLLGAVLGPVVFCTLPLTSTINGTLAATIPFACRAVGLDPAFVAAPAMTTLVDVTGHLGYFVLANHIFQLFGMEL